MAKLLFVCTGNTCRSNMAAAIARKDLERRGKAAEVEVVSAGTFATEGSGASAPAVRVMAEQGIDLTSHRAKILTVQSIQEADLILAMTKAHLAKVLQMHPGAADKAFTLLDYAGEGGLDVPDPIHGTMEDYRNCARRLEEAVALLLDKFLSPSS